MAARAQAGILSVMAVLGWSSAHAQCSISDVQWLTGEWHHHDAKRTITERWQTISSNELVELAWNVDSSGAVGVVALSTIVGARGMVVLRERHFDALLAHASEERDSPIWFVATVCKPDLIQFEGQQKWKGGKVTFRRAGDFLTVTGIVRDNGESGHYENVFTKGK